MVGFMYQLSKRDPIMHRKIRRGLQKCVVTLRDKKKKKSIEIGSEITFSSQVTVHSMVVGLEKVCVVETQ